MKNLGRKHETDVIAIKETTKSQPIATLEALEKSQPLQERLATN